MERSSEKRRAWVKNAAIIFLTFLLLLTFFSNTILNYSLPEVSAQYANSGTLTTAVKVDGTVKANESYKVIYEASQAETEDGVVQSRKVVSVFVKDGDMVEKDAPILALQGGMSEQLTKVQSEYDAAKREYDLALLQDVVDGLNAGKTLENAKQALEDEKKKLTELQNEYYALLGGADTKTLLEAKLEKLNAELEEIVERYNAANDKKTEIEGKIETAKGMIEVDIFSNLTVAEKLAAAEEEFELAEDDYINYSADLEFYKESLAVAKANSESITEANTLTKQLETLEDQLEALQLERERYIEDYWNSNGDEYSNYAQLLAAYESAERKYNKYLNENEADIDRLEACQLTLDNANNVLSKLNERIQYYNNASSEYEFARQRWLNSLVPDVSDEEKAILKNEADRLKEVLDGAEANLPEDSEVALAKDDVSAAQSALNEIQEKVTQLSTLESEMKKAKTAFEAVEGTEIDHTDYERKLEDYENKIDDLEEQIDEVVNKLNIIGMPKTDNITDFAASHSLAEIQKLHDDTAAVLTEAEKRYTEAKTEVESLRKQNMASDSLVEFEALLAECTVEFEAVEAEKKAKEKEITAAEKELASADTAKDPETAAAEIEKTKNNIKSLETELAIVEANQSKSDAQTTLDRADQLAKIEELAKKIESYKSAPETTSVTAPIAGRIVSVNYVPGSTVTSGDTVASIEIADQGYVCEITMSAEEARKIQVGTPCTIVNNWWYSNIEASVTQIRPDPQSQGKNRIVVIEVNGDVSEGQSIKFSIGDKSQTYDTVLPNSAIREDNNGKFVLVVESKNSALGVKYTAKRVDIEVIASDDTKSAVSGLYGSEFVITDSEIPVADKQRVRLAEN